MDNNFSFQRLVLCTKICLRNRFCLMVLFASVILSAVICLDSNTFVPIILYMAIGFVSMTGIQLCMLKHYDAMLPATTAEKFLGYCTSTLICLVISIAIVCTSVAIANQSITTMCGQIGDALSAKLTLICLIIYAVAPLLSNIKRMTQSLTAIPILSISILFGLLCGFASAPSTAVFLDKPIGIALLSIVAVAIWAFTYIKYKKREVYNTNF